MIDPHPIVLVAMGGHAFMQPGEAGTIGDHERNAAQIASLLMTLVERDYYLCITHGNGPQVGSLLLQQEHAREEVPSLPLDVLVAMTEGSLEQPVNPLLYVLGYGASFVAQGTPADMQGLAGVVEEGIRFPGFAFVNVQSPCVTYGQEEQQLKAHKTAMQPLASLGHDPSDRLKAMALASEYGQKLYTGVFYRNPDPPPTFEAQARRRQEEAKAQARPKDRILEMFQPR